MASIFLSYSRQSKVQALSLVGDIEALGHKVWFDQELSGGQAWWDQTLSNIRACDAFLLVLDHASLNSTACQREFDYAANLDKAVLPVLVGDDVATNLLPPVLSLLQFVDYRKQDRQAALHLAKALTSLPAVKPLPDPLPPPPEAPISYLGGLNQRVEGAETLDYQQQSALLLDLKRGMRDPQTFEDARAILAKLRKRPDLFATIAEEIDDMLKGQAQEEPRVSAKPPPRRPEEAKTMSLDRRTVETIIWSINGTALFGIIGSQLTWKNILWVVVVDGFLLAMTLFISEMRKGVLAWSFFCALVGFAAGSLGSDNEERFSIALNGIAPFAALVGAIWGRIVMGKKDEKVR